MLFLCLFYPSPHSQQGCAGAPVLVVFRAITKTIMGLVSESMPSLHPLSLRFHLVLPLSLIYSAPFRQKYTCLSQRVYSVIGV